MSNRSDDDTDVETDDGNSGNGYVIQNTGRIGRTRWNKFSENFTNGLKKIGNNVEKISVNTTGLSFLNNDKIKEKKELCNQYKIDYMNYLPNNDYESATPDQKREYDRLKKIYDDAACDAYINKGGKTKKRPKKHAKTAKKGGKKRQRRSKTTKKSKK